MEPRASCILKGLPGLLCIFPSTHFLPASALSPQACSSQPAVGRGLRRCTLTKDLFSTAGGCYQPSLNLNHLHLPPVGGAPRFASGPPFAGTCEWGRTLNRGSLFSVPSAVEVLCKAFPIPFPLLSLTLLSLAPHSGQHPIPTSPCTAVLTPQGVWGGG